VIRAGGCEPATRRRLLRIGAAWAAVSLVVSLPALAGTAPVPGPGALVAERPGIAELMRSARLWESLGQPAAEAPVLLKILAVDRTHPAALLLMAQIELERGDFPSARRRLALLEGAHPHATETRELRELVRLHEQDGARLAQLRVLEHAGRMREALVLARALFPDGRPPGALADEFATLLGRDAVLWLRLRELLLARLAAFENPVDREALAGLLSLHEETQAQAMAGFESLAGQHRGASDHLAVEWKRAIGRMPEGEAAQVERRRYLARFGHDPAVEADLARFARAREQRLAALDVPAPARPPEPAAQADSSPAAGETRGSAAESLPEASAVRDEARRLREAGDAVAARALLERALTRQPDEPWLRFDLARDLLAGGEQERALGLAREGVARRPGDADARFAAGLVLAAADRNDEALAAIAAIPAKDRSQGMDELERRLLGRKEDLAARTRPWLEAGTMFTRRSATEGLSSLRGTESPVRLSWPLPSGLAFFQADAVRLDGGTPSPADAPELGSLSVNAARGAFAASSRGASVAGGWRGEERRWDLGVIGTGGFAVSNWVGSWRESRAWPDAKGAPSASLQLSRRAITGSRLSYAGEIDPGTGITWGGVTNNEVSLRLAGDFPDAWSGATSLALSTQVGRHVQANQAIQSRTTLDRPLLRAPGTELRAGAVASLWHYARNENSTTLGQGGYYSPQRYASLGLSLSVDFDRGPWSAQLRATPSRSWSREDASPRFPLDPALQSAAANPHTAPASGGGLSGSLHAALLYRLAPAWAAGGWLDIDRSAYYAPTTAMLYLRWSFAGSISPAVPAAPLPVSRY
jgi:thioredoxin-like negative regulator of GroEL